MNEKTNHSLPYEPIALLDEDPRKIGLKIHGVPVVGLVADLKQHIELTKAEEILISIASASGGEMMRFVALCQTTKLPFKIIQVLEKFWTIISPSMQTAKCPTKTFWVEKKLCWNRIKLEIISLAKLSL